MAEREMRDLIEKLAEAVSASADFFNARDEMNAAVHTPAPMRLSPITVQVNEALQAWRDWNFGGPSEQAQFPHRIDITVWPHLGTVAAHAHETEGGQDEPTALQQGDQHG